MNLLNNSPFVWGGEKKGDPQCANLFIGKLKVAMIRYICAVCVNHISRQMKYTFVFLLSGRVSVLSE